MIRKFAVVASGLCSWRRLAPRRDPRAVSVLSSPVMRCERHRIRPRGIVPLFFALLLHGLGLVLAAAFGFSIPVKAEESPDTFVLSWTSRLAPAQEEEGLATALVEEVAEEVVEQVEPALPGAEEEPVEDLIPELVAQELGAEDPLPEPAPEEPEVAVLLDPAPEDPLGFDPPGVAARRADATDSPALATAPDSVPAAAATGIGVGAKTRDPSATSRPAGPGAGAMALGDVQGKGGVAAVGPRPGKPQATIASAPRSVVMREPKPLEMPPPAYPRLSRRAGEEGSVLCRLHISTAGKVTEIDVVESSGFERLDEAARKTLLGWRFEPRSLDGICVAATLLHRVTFKLES